MIKASDRTAEFHYAIRDIVAAAETLERHGRKVIHLNIGDPQAFGFRAPEYIVEAVQHALKDRFTGYAHSAGLPEAREAVAEYATGLGSDTTPDEVIITAGASEAADLVLTALLNPGDEVLLPAPGYPLYPAIVSKLGAVSRYYRLDPLDNWQPSVDEISRLMVPETKAIVLINPNNPTGAITRDETTSEIIEMAGALGILVISDEVYRELCFSEPPKAASVLGQEIRTPIITLESLSKTHMLSGWRVGWMRFSHAEKMSHLISAITKLASGRLCSPTPAQYAVKPALEGDAGFQHEFLNAIKLRRDFAVSRVNMIDGLSCTTPEAAFYLMIKDDFPGGGSDEHFVKEMLESTGVLVVPGSGFGCKPGDGYFRMVYFADKEILDQAFDEISRFVSFPSVEPTAM